MTPKQQHLGIARTRGSGGQRGPGVQTPQRQPVALVVIM